jgi:hypothetical protein
MALISCPECNSHISDTSPSCPQCGFERTEEAKIAASPYQYVLKHLVDLYFGLMVVGWSLDFISKDMAFVQYNVKIAQFTLYPWFVVPIVIAAATRPFLNSILYLAVIVTFIAFAFGPEYVTFFE